MGAVMLNAMGRAAGIACASLVLLTGCANLHAPAADTGGRIGAKPRSVAADRGRQYVDEAWGFRITTPAGWEIRRGFAGSYLADGAWKTYASPGSRGVAILALVLPGSNGITDAEIRVGASRDPAAIRRCTQPPSAVRPDNMGRERVGGVTFTTFATGDAAMSHWLDVRAYRVVHDGACYALDLLVYGTNPAVYDPPAALPFPRPEAFARMRAIVQTFRFTR